MFMRLLQIKVKPESVPQVVEFYETRVFQELSKVPGCLYAGILQHNTRPEEGISMTLWKTKKDAEKYEASGISQILVYEIEPLILETSEFRLQLSENLELECTPVPEEPTIKSYELTEQKQFVADSSLEKNQMCTRIVYLTTLTEKHQEFVDIYRKEIIPVLQDTDGCLHVYLMENIDRKGEIISVTIWSSQDKARRYEESGEFQRLVDKVKHTFSQFIQWSMAVQEEPGRQIRASDEMVVACYNLLKGKNF
jgi:heme-degrading monooxygenase HmoA